MVDHSERAHSKGSWIRELFAVLRGGDRAAIAEAKQRLIERQRTAGLSQGEFRLLERLDSMLSEAEEREE